jgi:hypothetical protein
MSEIEICHCGNTEDNHNFRHVFSPSTTIRVEEKKDGQTVFTVNANDFKSHKKEGKCSVPQCSGPKGIHGTIIKHEYKPSEMWEYRNILFRIPDDTCCNECYGSLKGHKSLTHVFTTKVVVENKTEYDIVTIKGIDDEKIKWE